MNEKLLEYVEGQLQADLDEQVAKVRRAAAVRIPDDFEGECVECGDLIPHGRLKTGAITCIECQKYIEAVRGRKHARRETNDY